MSRPPLISSTVAAFLASIGGEWKLVHASRGPSWTLLVTAASAASVDHASQGPTTSSGRTYWRWSPTQSESNPTSSATLAISSSFGHGATYSTSGSCTPTFKRRLAVIGGVYR